MTDNPYTTPKADLTIQETNPPYTLASRGKRLGASLIDSIIGIILTMPILYLTGIIDRLRDQQGMSFLESCLFGLLGIVLFIIVHGHLLRHYGQTVGKKLLKIRIADLEGNLPTLQQHLIPRYGFMFFWQFIPVAGKIVGCLDPLFIFRKNKRCLHDLVAKTIVINN